MEFDGLIEIVTHPSIADDDTFPDNMEYGTSSRNQERIYLIETIDYLRQLQSQTVGTA